MSFHNKDVTPWHAEPTRTHWREVFAGSSNLRWWKVRYHEVQCVDTCIKKEGTMCQPKGWSENEGEKERLMLGYYNDRQLDEGKEWTSQERWWYQEEKSLDVHVIDAASITHATLLRQYSCTIVHPDLVDCIGIQFNNEGLDMFVCSLSQSSLMSNWFTNRFQIWMIMIRCGRTCPALLIENLTWMTNWSSTRTSTGTGSTVELDDR